MPRKKIIHLASVKSAAKNQGVLEQMEWERLAAAGHGMQWDVELWSADPAPTKEVQRVFPRFFRHFLGRRLYFVLRLLKAARTHDVIVVRHSPLNIFCFLIPKRLRSKIIYVFHTSTEGYLRTSGGAAGLVLAAFDRLVTRKAVEGIAGAIGVTDEIVEHEKSRLNRDFKKVIIYPNGVYLDDWSKPIMDQRSGPLKIIFIASHFFVWNGLKDVLASINTVETDLSWEFHLVGRLTKNQIKSIKSNKFRGNIKQHGVLGPNEIASLMSSMDLSLAAFRLDRINATMACSLKVRESLGHGVPVYAGHEDVALSGRLECYIEGPPDWSEVLRAALSFRKKSKGHVKELARIYIDKSSLVLSLENSLNRCSGD